MEEKPIRLFRPSNGTHGEIFMEGWCMHCARDKAMSEGKPFDECDDNEKCQIIADTFAYDVNHPKYPREWIYGEDGEPKCTAFVEVGKPIPQKPCPNTPDMFSD